MAEVDSLERLQDLHRDLLALSENRLPTIERLWAELEARIEEFRRLLDKPGRNEKSRQTLLSGSVQVNGVEYAVSDQFKQDTVQISDALDLDELESAKLYIYAQDDSQELDRSSLASAIIRFHKRRQFLLEALRLACKFSTNEEDEDDIKGVFREFVRLVLNFGDGRTDNGSAFWRRCLSAMSDIEKWLQQLAERLQSASITGQTPSFEFLEIIDFQRSTLLIQHQSLAAISAHLVQGDYTTADDLRYLISERLKNIDRHDIILIDYIPVLLCSITRFGASDSSCPLEDSSSLNNAILAGKDSAPWALRNFHAATVIWWLGEHSGRFSEGNRASTSGDKSAESEGERRSALFMEALRDGGFHFMLSVMQDVGRSDWYDPAKAGLVAFLLQETPALPSDSVVPSAHVRELIKEQMQSFVEAFVTNLPDTLRRLKTEEDEQRRQLTPRFGRSAIEYEMHLERFLVIVGYAFDGSPEAAQAFWSDPDGNLFGFLQWAAKRQTTPRVAAFCEMFRAISESQECADAAHRFLLEEGASTSGKLRRTGSLNWNQIFSELHYYASSIKDRPAPTQTSLYPPGHPLADGAVEPESPMMLECYLRLVAHLCRASPSARDWVLSHTTFHLHEVLLQLSGSSILSRLRGCAFTALAALLTGKSPEVGDGMWTSLDQWIHGGIAAPNMPRATTAPAWSEQMIFDAIATGFEEPNAFVGLLHALVVPYSTDTGLHDTLPFPENLGTAYRMPGIDSYVDFVVGRCFGTKSLELQDPLQVRILRLNCLNFIATCLSTFNEDLVIIANRSKVAVDSAIECSSLSAYVRLHPFARVMEWLFNERVLTALFATAHQDIEEANNAASDSPLVLSLFRSIEVMNLVMKLQPTYLDIVRPVVKTQSSNRRLAVANSALASFEDAVLNNLQIIVDLGLYCGTGHQDLTICSLALLEKLSSSRKLVVSPTAGFGQRSDRSKIIGILEKDRDAERVARSLISEMQVDTRELEAGPDAPGYVLKTSILGFLKNCLAASPDRVTVAHLLLGFSCNSNSIEVDDDSLIAKGASLFHAIARLAVDFPDVDATSFLSWLTAIRQGSLEVLQRLWRSPISSAHSMAELRAIDFPFAQATKQVIVDVNTMYDGKVLSDPEFVFTGSAVAFRNFLQERFAFYDYFSREVRTAYTVGTPSLKSCLQSTLLGLTILPGGEQMQNLNVFDLFDFMELEVGGELALPPLKLLGDLDFSICKQDGADSNAIYDLKGVEELLVLRKNELVKSGRILTPNDGASLASEIQNVLLCLHGMNQRHEIIAAHSEALRSWVRLVTVMLECCDFEPGAKISFTTQALQLVLPKLERSFSDNILAAVELAALTRTLLQSVSVASPELGKSQSSTARPSDKNNTGDFASDRLFQLFRTSINGIYCLVATSELREICYQTCYRYLRGILKSMSKGSSAARQSLRTVQASGERLMEVLCDDAYAGQGTCRVSALLLLDALVCLATREDSKYMIESFGRLNLINVLVDGIKNIPTELRETPASDIPLVLSYYDASLSLLLRISQTRLGAAHVVAAGLFQAVRESQIFSADPDLGLEFENPHALRRFFELMLSVLRVINAMVLSRGQQNSQTITQAREFLKENRQSMVAVFKRNARIGGQADNVGDLSDLVDNFTLLVSAVGFLEYEDKATTYRSAPNVFS